MSKFAADLSVLQRHLKEAEVKLLQESESAQGSDEFIVLLRQIRDLNRTISTLENQIKM
jgi:hypothetical protein